MRDKTDDLRRLILITLRLLKAERLRLLKSLDDGLHSLKEATERSEEISNFISIYDEFEGILKRESPEYSRLDMKNFEGCEDGIMDLYLRPLN